MVVRQDQGKMVALEEPPPGIIEIEQAERQLQVNNWKVTLFNDTFPAT